eukprot:136966-Pyramimonas_sp.AAC.2
MARRTEVFDKARRTSIPMAICISAPRSSKTSSAPSRCTVSAVRAMRWGTRLEAQSAARRGTQPVRCLKDQDEELGEDELGDFWHVLVWQRQC